MKYQKADRMFGGVIREKEESSETLQLLIVELNQAYLIV